MCIHLMYWTSTPWITNATNWNGQWKPMQLIPFKSPSLWTFRRNCGRHCFRAWSSRNISRNVGSCHRPCTWLCGRWKNLLHGGILKITASQPLEQLSSRKCGCLQPMFLRIGGFPNWQSLWWMALKYEATRQLNSCCKFRRSAILICHVMWLLF
jgi:hypothetical protein